MGSSTIIDLDKLVPPSKRVRLDGKTWTLPAEIPVPLYLQMKAAQQRLAENPDAERDIVQETHDECLALFRIHHPQLETLPVGLVQLFKIIPTIYPEMGGAPEEEEADPNPTGRTGKSTTTRRTTRSGS